MLSLKTLSNGYYQLISFAFEDRRVVQNPNMPTIANERRMSDACAMKPISGGPIRNPRKLIDDTAAKAIPAPMLVDFPAAL